MNTLETSEFKIENEKGDEDGDGRSSHDDVDI